MAKKMGLGRGLSAILPDVEEVVESVDQVSESAAPVPADAVAGNPLSGISTRTVISRAKSLTTTAARAGRVHPP
ncbi:MAG: hypothetical protein ACLUHE_14440 [Christensenellales bacterium]